MHLMTARLPVWRRTGIRHLPDAAAPHQRIVQTLRILT
jgi:hypothetical protein